MLTGIVNNASTIFGLEGEGRSPTGIGDMNGQSSISGKQFQPSDCSGGDRHNEASLDRGLTEVAGTLLKLTVITILALVISKGIRL